MSQYSDLLQKFRREAGHDSGRSFYKAAGGKPALKCTYQQYLNIEAGRSVPKAAVFYAAAVHLRLWKDPDRSGAYCRAYMEACLGGGEPYEFLLRSLAPSRQPGSSQTSPLRKAMQRDLQGRLAPLTPEQSALIKRDPSVYWTYHVLAGDSGYWDAAGIARLFGFPAGKVRAALEALGAAGLAQKDRRGWWSPYRERHVQHSVQPAPRAPHEVAAAMERTGRLWDAAGSREPLFKHYIFLRASESQLREYYPYLAMTLDGLEVYDTLEKGADTSFVAVEASAYRLKRF